MGQNPSSNPKSPESTSYSQVWNREKVVHTPDVSLLSLPRETVVLVQKILEVFQNCQTRET